MEGCYFVHFPVLHGAGTIVACHFVHFFETEQFGMRIDQRGGIFCLHPCHMIIYSYFEAAQEGEEVVAELLIYVARQFHQLFFPPFEYAVLPDRLQYFLLIRWIDLFEQYDQTVPVFGYRRDVEELLRKPVGASYIMGEILRTVGRKLFVVFIGAVGRGVSAYIDLFYLCIATFQYRSQQAVHLAQFLAVVFEVGEDLEFA